MFSRQTRVGFEWAGTCLGPRWTIRGGSARAISSLNRTSRAVTSLRPRLRSRLRQIMGDHNPFARLVSTQTCETSRLAVLEPSEEPDAPIKLTLIDADLKNTSYECISYERAKNPNIVNIVVNDEDYEIPQALESALRTFRRKEKPRTLWADLLVGRTVEERSSQATAMRQILENADKTLCWLGPQKELTSRAFDIVHDMANQWSQACVHVNLSPDVGLSRVTIKQMDGIREKLSEPVFPALAGFDFKIWNELYDIFGASYWSSVHCIPEIVLAKAVIIVCGRSNIRWPNYVGASRALPFLQAKYQQVPLLPRVMKAFTIISSIEIAERRRRLGESIELFPMLQTARECEAQDPRDYIFSMIPISTPSRRLEFHNAGPQTLPAIDYSKSMQEVFINAARYIVLERQDMMLWFGERPPCARRVKDLPTWVPDFSAGDPPGHRIDPNNGLRNWWDTVQPRKNIRVSDDNALLVQAYALDSVEHVSRVFDAGNFSSLCYEEFQKLPDPINETIEQRDERFWRTLLMNVDAFGGTLAVRAPPSAAMGTSFESIIAQETVLKLLGCTPNQIPTPEIQARMMTMPEVMALLPKCGKGEDFAARFCKQSLGRRFFRTKAGRFGMTAVEDVISLDPKLADEERKAQGPSNEGDVQNITRMLADPMTRMMMGGFQQFLQERDPAMANILAQAERGEFAFQQEDQLSKRGGVTKGDIVVALIGGFFPYILRPKLKAADEGADEGASQLGVSDSAYEFVGDCYLHGSMNGEDFKIKSFIGTTHYKTDMSKIVDISIV
ncbi:hypothetical protein F4680DRAFT_85982 [Xylaria scruposa]|nr:hypothetical protein F4680DRAFT_85982 [Xylaria scruposa]